MAKVTFRKDVDFNIPEAAYEYAKKQTQDYTHKLLCDICGEPVCYYKLKDGLPEGEVFQIIEKVCCIKHD